MGMHFKKTATVTLSAAALMGAGVANAAQVPSIDPGFSMTAPTNSGLITPLPQGAEKLEPKIEGQTITGELHSVKEDGKLSVAFSKDHSLVMNDGCNTYNTTYEVAEDGTISVGNLLLPVLPAMSIRRSFPTPSVASLNPSPPSITCPAAPSP